MNDSFIIHSYTRQEAIEDGFLVDVSTAASEAGFKYPVALTRTVFEDCVAVPAETSGQDETGRLWDILVMLRWNIQAAPERNLTDLGFTLQVVGPLGRRMTVRLKAVCGPGDDAEPVITIMFPHED